MIEMEIIGVYKLQIKGKVTLGEEAIKRLGIEVGDKVVEYLDEDTGRVIIEKWKKQEQQ